MKYLPVMLLSVLGLIELLFKVILAIVSFCFLIGLILLIAMPDDFRKLFLTSFLWQLAEKIALGGKT